MASTRSLISPALKLLTPMAHTLPLFFASTSAFQTAAALSPAIWACVHKSTSE